MNLSTLLLRRRMMMQEGSEIRYFDYMEFPYIGCGAFLTDIIPSYATEIEVCLKHRAPSGHDLIFCGCENTLWNYRMAVWVFAGYLQAAKTSTSWSYWFTSDTNAFDKKVIIKIGNNRANYEFDGGQSGYKQYNTPNPFDNRVGIAIGGSARVDFVYPGFIGDFYYLKVWENNNLVADFRAHADNEFVNILNGDIIRNFVQGGQTYARNE